MNLAKTVVVVSSDAGHDSNVPLKVLDTIIRPNKR